MKKIALLACLFILSINMPYAQSLSPITLKWVDSNPLSGKCGVSWGVPFASGTIKKNQLFNLVNEAGNTLPVQTWPTAYWPDGSIKWLGLATVTDSSDHTLLLSLAKARPTLTKTGLQITNNQDLVKITTGKLSCVIKKNGNYLLDSLIINGRIVAGRGRLECVLQNGPDGENFDSPVKEHYISKVNEVTVEQNGPVRAVVRVQGVMKAGVSQREWLPFSIRLYFYAGSPAIHLINTIIYDGNQQKDFIKGIGLVFSVPMRENLINRHIRFGGEDEGIWGEPVRPMYNKKTDSAQIAGEFIDPSGPVPRAQEAVRMPVWNDFKLVQSNADGFNIQKRTNIQSTWLDVTAGRRATGFVFAGDKQGGLGIGLKDFWQSYPSAIEVRNSATAEAEIRIWLWSPYNDAMDMRHYDTAANDPSNTYEDVQPGLSTPYGVARTSEFTLFPCTNVPSNRQLSQQAHLADRPPLLAVSPEYIHSAKVFGFWSLPDRSTPGKRWIESQLDTAITFYQKEIDQRNWYGFWNFGDVMHTYDDARHSWRYDLGGFAWDNTELSTDMWLWYSYLRSGRADIFRMAEALTRHTSEVDVYHIGPLAGLGSRHNVRHWGDGSKEVRESQAAYRRFYYYLTTDERTGDMMREVAQSADISMSKLDPLREKLSKTQYPTHARIGPDWLALVGNWMTEWERTGDNRWRDQIMAGIKSFEKMPSGFFSGQQGAFGYDPATKKMYQLNDTIGSIHLSVLMGGPEVVFELKDLLQDKKINDLWLQFAKFYGSSKSEQLKEFGKTGDLGALARPWYARMPAYAAKITGDSIYAKRAWQAFLAPKTNMPFTPHLVQPPTVLKPLIEVRGANTNNTAQWCLNAIELLEMIGDKIPADHPFWNNLKSK